MEVNRDGIRQVEKTVSGKNCFHWIKKRPLLGFAANEGVMIHNLSLIIFQQILFSLRNIGIIFSALPLFFSIPLPVYNKCYIINPLVVKL